MSNEDGTVWVAFNGEIYNHGGLRNELQQRGHRFRGRSDTEVLVHLYEEYGPRLVERLNGIFAFALYDRPAQRLVLARDGFGVKPLFYAVVGRQWVFASEIKAITALPAFRPVLDRQACYDFLGLGYVPEPATGFANVVALPKGTVLTVRPEGHQVWRYHAAAARPDPERELSQTVDALSDTLLEVVRGQSAADVPVAGLLSGGIDSSLVVAAHRRATGADLVTFNVRFPDSGHDETALARAVAAQYHTEHHTIDGGDHVLTADAVLGLLRHFDQPFADTSCIPTYWVSAAVRDRGIICTLSGDGGDEAFGGYARFWRANRLHRLMGLPAWSRAAALRLGRALEGHTRDWGRQLAKAVALAEGGRTDSAALIGGLSQYLTEPEKAALVTPAARDGLVPGWRHFDSHVPAGTTDLEELSRRMTECLLAVSLLSDMLRKVDMMSMLASIEVRVPLLDEAIVGLGLRLPHRLKTDGRRGKLVLRALARRWLPPVVTRHPKHGFSIPLDVMVAPEFHRSVEELLRADDARTRPIFNRALTGRWLSAFATARRRRRQGGAVSREGLWQRVFMVLALELWLREYRLSW